ncbi:MAG TPA: SRPBCC family protein [Candidatus Angelobacter sp.]|jgi:uncharacterized protein YndB with AHSA1/START domain|nr:SRPBCC family protein [Candidatus Angelobacter sp.]
MLKKIAIGIVVIVVAILAYAATKPDTFSVQRAAGIKAPPEKIFALIQDFHNWGTWSPWEKLDPNMKRTFSGPPSGKGSAYAWEGNRDAGAGSMEITDATPAKVTLKLDFIKPFEAHNNVEFTLTPQGDSTNVTWVMSGPNSYMSKLMQTFMSMDKMVGKDFETGLSNLKAAAEK